MVVDMASNYFRFQSSTGPLTQLSRFYPVNRSTKDTENETSWASVGKVWKWLTIHIQLEEQ